MYLGCFLRVQSAGSGSARAVRRWLPLVFSAERSDVLQTVREGVAFLSRTQLSAFHAE